MMSENPITPLQMQNEAKINILLVDDLPENLLALEAILSDSDYRHFHASSGREALRFLMNNDFAVILLDVVMPEMDGYETAVLIRQSERSKHIPIIFMTACEKSEVNSLQGYATGAADYLFKPLVPEILKTKVRVFADLYRLQQANMLLIRQLQERNEQIRTLSGIINLCMNCKKVHNPDGSWEILEKFLTSHTDAQISHGLCKECLAELYPEYSEKLEKLSQSGSKP